AREGASTVLIEKNSFPGGTGITGLHRFICGLYANTEDVPDKILNKGIAEEICFMLQELAPEKIPLRMGKVYVLPFATSNFMSVLRSLSEKEKQLEIYYNTRAVSAKTENNTIVSVTIRNLNKKFDIIPRVVIDCSGDGVIIKLSGARYKVAHPDQRQLSGYTFRVKGLENATDILALKVPYYLSKAAEQKKIPPYLKYTTFVSGDDEDEGYCKLNIPPALTTKREKQAKKDALLVYNYLAKVLPVFNKSYIVGMSPEVVDREGPRLYGKYTLTANDVINARKFPDGIVKSAWPIEMWDQQKGVRYRYLGPGDNYEIPLRCLISKDISNLYCAGRCISVTAEALGSTRVMGTCISLGERAGYGAAHW
ncbi:MAG: FAD-dependent oxidoreductase, partial [Desulfobacterales bacterium]|nr:FAD-dependent oxidoreductase [Desulfobacterales bacterium]